MVTPTFLKIIYQASYNIVLAFLSFFFFFYPVSHISTFPFELFARVKWNSTVLFLPNSFTMLDLCILPSLGLKNPSFFPKQVLIF